MEGYWFLLMTSASFSGIYGVAMTPDMKTMTKGCGETKTCFLPEKDCVKYNNCTIGMTVVKANDTYYDFELQTTRGVYVAVGLSNDTKMGNDTVVQCYKTVNGTVDVITSWNKGYTNTLSTLSPDYDGIALLDSSYRDGSLYCKFNRYYFTRVSNVDFMLTKTQYHVLLAAGTGVQANGAVHKHDIIDIASIERRYLHEIGTFNSSSSLQNFSFLLLVQFAIIIYLTLVSSI